MKRFYLFIIALLSFGFFGAASAWSAVVTLDVTQKSASSDTDTLTARTPRFDGNQAGIYVGSTIKQPQSFTLKITGIRNEDYDIYVSGSYLRKESAEHLKDGIDLSISGTAAQPDQMRCLEALKDKIKPEIDRLSKMNDPEPQRALWTLRMADDWVRTGIRSDESYRSLDIVVTPAGSILKKMQWQTRLDAEGTAKAAGNACNLLQQARARMSEVIKDPNLRNSVVMVMTPVTFTAESLMVNGRSQIKAKIVNDCNLPISGTVVYALPKGWKSDSALLKFENLGSGKMYQATFKLTAASNNAETPSNILVMANVRIDQGKYKVKFKLVNSVR